VLARQATNGPLALAASKIFAADASQFRGAQAFAWVNVRAAMDQLAREPVPLGGAEGGEGHPALSISQMLQALGFGALQTVSFSLQESAAGTAMALRARVAEADRKGLFKVLSLESKDSAPPALVPGDVVKFSRARLDLPRVWGHLEAILAEASPAAAGILKFIISTAGKDKEESFDLRERLIAQLGDDLISYEKPLRSDAARPAETERSLILVGAPNPDRVVAAVKVLPSLLPPESTRLKEREFLGRTVHSVTLPHKQEDGSVTTGPAWHYAAGGAHVAFSSDASMIEDYLRSSGAVSRPLREQDGLAEAAQAVGGMNTGFFSYENTREAARGFFESVRKDSYNAASILGALRLGGRLGLGHEGGMLSWCDFYLLPPFERTSKYFYFDVATLSAGPDGYTYRFFAPVPPRLKN
jgi:hypothetical protein